MPLTITKLKMWKNPGYTRNCLEVPPVGSWKLPAPDFTSAAGETYRPMKDSILTAIELPLSYISVFEMSYIYIEASNGGSTIKLFGWIDRIQMVASSNENIKIYWTVDWWRTYSHTLTYGTGRITRCNNATYKRPFQTQPRLWTVKHYEKLINYTGDYETYPYCAVLAYNFTTPNSETIIRFAYWRCSQTSGETITVGGTTYKSMSISQIFSSVVDERLGIDPDDVIGIFIVPFEPWIRNQNSIITHHATDGNDYFAYIKPSNIASSTFSCTYINKYESNDMLKTVIIDPNGSIVYTLPWGYKIDAMGGSIDAGTIACNMIFKLALLASPPSGPEAAISGLMGSIPGLPAPFNSNAYSSYVYSGQRDYDRELKNIQRDQQTVSGVTGISTSAIGGGIAGASGGPIGAAAGAIAGAASGIVGTAVNWVASGIFNDRLNNETDKLYSNQASNVIQSAGGMGFCDAVKNWYIVQMQADSVSAAEYTAHITKNGYSVDISTGSPWSFISAGGPLQIDNMVVTGNAPPEAKQYIKNLFSNGVIIQENNPAGVIP